MKKVKRICKLEENLKWNIRRKRRIKMYIKRLRRLKRENPKTIKVNSITNSN